MARLAGYSLAPISAMMPSWDDVEARLKAEREWYDREIGAGDKKALERLEAAGDDREKLASLDLCGLALRWQRGDGYAIYVVTKNRPLTLTHVDYGDAWKVEAPLIRGLSRDDVISMGRSRVTLNRLFGQREG